MHYITCRKYDTVYIIDTVMLGTAEMFFDTAEVQLL